MAASEPTQAGEIASQPKTYTGTCDKHGQFIGKIIEFHGFGRELRIGCPACSAERKAADDEEELRRKAWAEEQARIRDIESRRAAGVPVRFDGKTLDSFLVEHEGHQRALDACRRVVDAVMAKKTAPNLILTGKPGTGKTHLACGMTLALYRSRTVRRIDLPDMIRNIRATWQKGSEYTEAEVLDFYGSVDLLILEEVGTGSGSDDERARVFQVINRRYEAMLPTVVVTNLTLRELRDEMGERVLDRLREGDRAVMAFDWESMRAKA